MNEFYFFITELSHIRKLKEFSRMSCGLKELRQKVYCFNSSATVGSDNSLTPLTSELAKKEALWAICHTCAPLRGLATHLEF